MTEGLAKRYCLEYVDGTVECFRDNGGFWYTQKGQIVKWSILGALFALFMLWFIGGYVHATRRMKAGKPLLGYHRVRKRYGQPPIPPQNHFTFYASQNPYQNRPEYAQRADGSWPQQQPPPMYGGGEGPPPQYFAPPGAGGADKVNGSQGVEMGQFGGGVQQSGVVGGGDGRADVEQGGQTSLPPRPPMRAKAVLKGFTERFRK